MAEIMRRRFGVGPGRRLMALISVHCVWGNGAHQTDGLSDWPDVVMIDGGKGQLSAVMEALRELTSIKIIMFLAVAESSCRKVSRSTVGDLWGGSAPAYRDEAHRFAVSFHRGNR